MDDEVSLSTRLQIEADEERELLRETLGRFGFAVLSFGLWFASRLRTGELHFFVVGLSALPAAATLWRWWRRRRMDPAERSVLLADEIERRQERERVAAAMKARRPFITVGLTAILALIAVLQFTLAGSLSGSVEAAGLVKSAVAGGEWWRLITATYLHGSPMHLVGNLIALMALGHMMEAFVARWHLPAVYMVSGLTASVVSYELLGATSIGASGAILGLGGYLLTVGFLEPGRLPRPVRSQVLMMIALTAYVGLFGSGLIDNAAHFGGALGGALMAWLLTPRGVDNRAEVPSQWNFVGVTACALILASAAGTTRLLALEGARSKVVSSVSISLADTRRDLTALISNHSEHALEAYRFQVNLDGRVVASGWRDDCCFGQISRQSPVAPNSSIRVPLRPVVGGVSIGRPSPQITLVVFDDGSFEGNRDQYESLMRQRASVADDAVYWRAAIDAQQSADFRSRYASLSKLYEDHAHASEVGRLADEALGIPQLVFAAGTNPEAYASVAVQTKVNLAAIELALRTRLAAAPSR